MVKKETRYGFHEASGQVIHISSAERGLQCGCVCPDCDSNLEAVKGSRRVHYFRHSNVKHCSGETAIHIFAKQVIADANSLKLPTGWIFYNKVSVEQKLDTKRPDLTLLTDKEELYIEIRVTHAVKDDKRQFYLDGKHKCIEIDLSDRNLRVLPPDELKRVILEETFNKAILCIGEVTEANIEKVSDNYIFNLITKLLLLLAAIFLVHQLVISRKRY